jgi:glycosyltransferase involved in cell wall biosynthesis
LRALERQTRAPDEVVIVDASDPPLDTRALTLDHPGLRLACVPRPAGLSAQRNEGVRRARGSHVLLCDDDVEPPPTYLEALLGHVAAWPATVAVSGLLSEPDATGAFPTSPAVPSFRHLLASFVFQLTVFGDVDAVEATPLTAAPLALLKRWYRRRGNRWSLAGWPLVTRVESPAFRTATYGLGAALVRRDALLGSPFDERLGTHGVGDHYGVALGFPGERAITVLTGLPVRHHRVPEHRLEAGEAHVRRALALDYFMRASGRFPRSSRVWLAWSLLGKAGLTALRGRPHAARASLRALALIATGRNPLLRPPDGGFVG